MEPPSQSFEDVPSYIQHYYPQFGRILSNGNIEVAWSGEEYGERMSGRIEIGQNHPMFSAWKSALSRKDETTAEEKQQRSDERELRRSAARRTESDRES